MISSIIVDLILWVVIAIIAIAWYIEYRNEKKAEREMMVYKDGVGKFGHLPGKYSAIM